MFSVSSSTAGDSTVWVGTFGGASRPAATGFNDRSWTGRADVEREPTAWVHWYKTTRLHSSIDYCAPTEFEDRYRDNTNATTIPPGGLNEASIKLRTIQFDLEPSKPGRFRRVCFGNQEVTSKSHDTPIHRC